MPQEWYEMRDLRRRRLSESVWVPLRCSKYIENVGKHGHLGHRLEFYGVGTVAVPVTQKSAAEKLGWMDIGISHSHFGAVIDEIYYPADAFEGRGISGVHLVLDQQGNSADPSEWHLHQDLALSLRLKRERDLWVSPHEGYTEVARLCRKQDGSPEMFEIRLSHLRDYLAARNMSLYVTTYRERISVVDNSSGISWPSGYAREESHGEKWEGNITSILAGGLPRGATSAVVHLSRTDVDPDIDVPRLGPPIDDNVQSRSWSVEHDGQTYFQVRGDLWRNEWIEPALSSPIVRGDDVPSTVDFIVDASGNRQNASSLVDAGGWLWFRPDVVLTLAQRRGGRLKWYTRDTGDIEGAPGLGVHFGMNAIGLVNVYGEDIALLPEWLQRVWAGYNVAPDGKVSAELLASQVRAEPAQTQAPEQFFVRCIESLSALVKSRFGISLITEHSSRAEIFPRIHRFRATDLAGLYALAKDVARVTVDSFDVAAMRKFLRLDQSEAKLGSLKCLERLIGKVVGPPVAGTLIAPLFGVYDLRLADAHLPNERASEVLRGFGIENGMPMVIQGLWLLDSCVGGIYKIVSNLSDEQSKPAGAECT